MKKEDEIIQFLDDRIFNPILNSETASDSLQRGARMTRMRMRERDAKGMISYYWSAIVETKKCIGFAKKLKEENFIRFEEVIDDFRDKFSDEWLRK